MSSYRIDNLTYNRLSISNMYLYPGVPAFVADLTDPLIEAFRIGLVLIDPAPGAGNTVTIVGSTVPVEVTVTTPLPITMAPVVNDTEYMDVPGTATQILAVDANRKALLIQNLAYTRSIWVAYSSAECVPQQCILIPPRYYKEFPNGIPSNEVWALSQVTNPGGGPAESVARISYEEGN